MALLTLKCLCAEATKFPFILRRKLKGSEKLVAYVIQNFSQVLVKLKIISLVERSWTSQERRQKLGLQRTRSIGLLLRYLTLSVSVVFRFHSKYFRLPILFLPVLFLRLVDFSVVHEACIERGCYPSPLNYKGFKKSGRLPL